MTDMYRFKLQSDHKEHKILEPNYYGNFKSNVK